MRILNFSFLISFLIPIVISAQEPVVVFQKDTIISNITEISVKSDFAKIAIKKSSKPEVSLSGLLKSNEGPKDYNIKCTVNGSQLSILVMHPAGPNNARVGELNISVPDMKKITLNSTSGFITLDGLKADSIKATAEVGNITGTKNQAAFLLNTAAGDIMLIECKGNITSKSNSGSQSFNKIYGNINAFSTSADINVVELHGNLTTESNKGSQQVSDVDGNINSIFYAGTSTIGHVRGNISGKFWACTLHMNHVAGALNITSSTGKINGEDIWLTGNSKFQSASGAIKVKFSNTPDQLKFVLSANDAFLYAMGKQKKNSLKIGKGSILVEGITKTGAQNYP